MFNASAISAGFNPGWVSVLAGGIFSAYLFLNPGMAKKKKKKKKKGESWPRVLASLLCAQLEDSCLSLRIVD